MVLYLENAARSLGYQEIRIRPADENNYVIAKKYPLESAKLRYDTTAKRMGYKYDEEKKSFVKNIETPTE